MILFFAPRGDGVGIDITAPFCMVLKLSNSSQLGVKKGYVTEKERHHSVLLHSVGTVQQFTARSKERLCK